MRARTLVVLGTLLGVVSADVAAQRLGVARTPGISISQNPGAPAPPAGPGTSSSRSSRPSPAPPSRPLPGPFAGTIPNPIVSPATPDDVFRARRRTYAPRYDRWSGGSRHGLWFPGIYGETGGYLPYIPDASSQTDAPGEGRLNLYVSPASAQVLVDGFYEGTVGDFQDRGMWLQAGPRRIELRAEGHDSVTFDVRIEEDRTVEYRRNLTTESRTVEPPRVAAKPKTFYVIPGCYAGDSPPEAGRLPGGCSARNVRTIPPLVSRITNPKPTRK
jgi:hypothetical protein